MKFKLPQMLIAISLLSVFSCKKDSSFQISYDGLVAYFPFNGNAIDHSNKNNVCTVTGCNLVADRFGNQSSAYSFDGINDRMVISHSSSLDFDAGMDSYSINLWVKASDPTNGSPNYGRLFSKWNDDLKYNYPFSLQYNSTNCLAAIYHGDSSNKSMVFYSNIWNDQWRMLTFVVDNSVKKIYAYVDGNLIETATNNATKNAKNVYDIVVGYCWPNSLYYKGLIDDILIYDRALSGSEIKSIFNQ